jgi:hypothetical protein
MLTPMLHNISIRLGGIKFNICIELEKAGTVQRPARSLKALQYNYFSLKVYKPIPVAARSKQSAAARLLRLWVLIPLGGIDVCLL